MRDTDPDPSAGLADWIRLALTPGVGRGTLRALVVEYASPTKVFQANHAALPAALARVLSAPAAPAVREQVARTLDWLAAPGHGLIPFTDRRYPPQLAAIADAPPLLYTVGRHELLSRTSLAIVGSRNATLQGQANAEVFAQALSTCGLTIVSGLALGIDAAAHTGALAAAGSTVAVTGTGADRIYPQRNAALARRIASEGCIVTEYPLGTPPRSANFPQRNRLISGLAAGVLVVEAAERSGSLITARLAADQGREVFAIPGSIHAALAKGCHRLIKEGAKLVESAADVLAELMPAAIAPAPPPAEAVEENALLAAIGHDPVDPEALVGSVGGDLGALHLALLDLELAGRLERLPSGLFQRLNR